MREMFPHPLTCEAKSKHRKKAKCHKRKRMPKEAEKKKSAKSKKGTSEGERMQNPQDISKLHPGEGAGECIWS
jgi:hypothetical protein